MFSLPDERFARVAGVDALAYVRYLWLCTKIAFLVTVISVCALLPTHLTSDFVTQEQRRQQRLNCKDTEAADAVAVRLLPRRLPPLLHSCAGWRWTAGSRCPKSSGHLAPCVDSSAHGIWANLANMKREAWPAHI